MNGYVAGCGCINGDNGRKPAHDLAT